MNRLNGIKEFIQSKFLTAAPIVLIAFVATGLFLFYSSMVDPALRNRDLLITQVADARKSIVNARGVSAQSPSELQTRLTSTQATLSASANKFLSPAQATHITDSLYEYADLSHVTITDLATQPSAASTDKTGVGVTTMRLLAQGDSHQLVVFVSMIKEASSKGFVINNMSITQDKAGPKLTMEITLYTSLVASNNSRAPGQPAPNGSATSVPTLSPAAASRKPTAANAVVPTTVPLPPQPTAVPPTATPGLLIQAQRMTAYLVRPGDTLTLIAHRYNTTIDALVASNGLFSNEIRVGQVLLVPMR
jgi:LysM repeat protein